MKFAVVIPDRGDRPAFMANCLRMISPQVNKEDIYIYREYLGTDGQPDITEKYAKAYIDLSPHYDLLFFIENDDWYRSDYIELMLKYYERAKSPDIFGIGYTMYYHLGLRKYFTFIHPSRASMMNTCLRTKLPRLMAEWKNGTAEPRKFLDMYLWNIIKGTTVSPPVISLGIKHGVGVAGGSGHNSLMERYIKEDNGFLKATLDEESFSFYNNIVTPQSWASRAGT